MYLKFLIHGFVADSEERIGHSRSSKIDDFGVKSAYATFSIVIHSKDGPTLHRF